MDDELPPLHISPQAWANTPLEVRLALQEVVALARELSIKVRDLEARVSQNSTNSSNPPSSDPPQAPSKPAKVPRGRKRGAQNGHHAHQRPLAPPESVTTPVSLHPTSCPHCAACLPANLPDARPLRRRQVWDLPVVVPEITEYQQHTVLCPGCAALVTAPLPSSLPPTAFGPRLTWTAPL